MCSSVFQLLGCLLRAAIKQVSKDLEASHNEALQQQHQRRKDHKKLRFQRGDQSEGPAQYWNNVTNFPALSAEPTLVAAPASPCKEMWSDLARKSASATMQCHSVMSGTPKVAETDTAHRYSSLPITAVASTRASAVTVVAQVKLRLVRAPALVGGVSMQHKVKKTGRTAVPLCSAAFEQSPAFDCGPPDACGVSSTVSPRSEGVVLRKGSSAAETSTSSPRGEDAEEEQKSTSAKLSHSYICTGDTAQCLIGVGGRRDKKNRRKIDGEEDSQREEKEGDRKVGIRSKQSKGAVPPCASCTASGDRGGRTSRRELR
ncbi:hypothetical protein HPB51_011571 [Rhipicephalus microplus]|uniref:Uncharacterized protein n=1 Tax=Rhipicephalus microplus TaxID=6941 RepID=A0A9J6EG83_RHIMP|nr:hypothetical protein HPB51_011571 [Rhipicephalus microplus]